MISDYVEAPWRLAQIRSTCVGPYIDDFTALLAAKGFKHHTIRGYIRSIDHLGRWANRRGIAVASWDNGVVVHFRRHLARCNCAKGNKGVFKGAVVAARLFLDHLRSHGVVPPAPQKPEVPRRALILTQFVDWVVQHRGVSPSTTKRYQRTLKPFLAALGEDPSQYTVVAIRAYVINQLHDVGRCETRSAVTSIRAYLRFLVAEGRVRAGIEQCVPTVPQWRLSSMPRYLEASDVERVLASCDRATSHGLRDHAILLLLARLGLRAGDIVRMSLDDIDWHKGTLRVLGKGRREVRLPLPQDVGDAVLAYLRGGRAAGFGRRVFLTVNAPTRPFATSASVSDIVRFALQRAGIQNPPSRGAHLLRHSAATAMLRAGGSLDTIATVLRHRSADTAAYYAKVDVELLRQIAQPWPEGAV